MGRKRAPICAIPAAETVNMLPEKVRGGVFGSPGIRGSHSLESFDKGPEIAAVFEGSSR